MKKPGVSKMCRAFSLPPRIITSQENIYLSGKYFPEPANKKSIGKSVMFGGF